jgi:FkbM family methyltransferase
MEKVTRTYKNAISYDFVAGYNDLRNWYAESETETHEWVIDHVQPDWTVFDLGAHIGSYTMLLSYLTPNGKVFAFEPCIETRRMFAANLAYNKGRWGCDFSNIRLVTSAVGNRTGHNVAETLWLTDGTPTLGKTTALFDMTTLDDFCITHNMVSRLDFIKCDVDGWDLDVLQGAQQVLAKYRPYLIAEVNYALAWRNHTFYEVDELLVKNHYCHKVIDPCPGQWLCWPEEKLV